MEQIKKFYISQPKKKKGNNTWYGQCKIGKKEISKRSLGTTLKKEALLWKQIQESKRFLSGSDRDETQSKLIREGIKEHFAHLESTHQNSKNTLVKYFQHLNKLGKFFKKKDLIEEVKEKDVQNFIDSLSKNLNPKGVHEVFKFSKNLFKRWVSYKYIKTNPFDWEELKIPKQVKKESPFWLIEEIEFILEKIAMPDTKSFWAVMAHAGLRLSEARFLKFTQIDFKNKLITVNGKGNKLATIPINSYLFLLLRKQYEKHKIDLVFPLIPKTANGCRKQFKKALHGIDFKIPGPMTPHRFRHSLASNLLRSGESVKAVQMLMRHSSSKMTLDIYGHLIQEDLFKAIEGMIPTSQKLIAFQKAS